METSRILVDEWIREMGCIYTRGSCPAREREILHEPGGPYAKRDKPDREGQMLLDLIYAWDVKTKQNKNNNNNKKNRVNS